MESKPLVLAIKNWVKSRKLNNTHRGDLNSFGFTLMIIHYFQTLSPPILPILEIDEEKYCQYNDKYEPEWVSSDKFVNFGKKINKILVNCILDFFIFIINSLILRFMQFLLQIIIVMIKSMDF